MRGRTEFLPMEAAPAPRCGSRRVGGETAQIRRSVGGWGARPRGGDAAGQRHGGGGGGGEREREWAREREGREKEREREREIMGDPLLPVVTLPDFASLC